MEEKRLTYKERSERIAAAIAQSKFECSEGTNYFNCSWEDFYLKKIWIQNEVKGGITGVVIAAEAIKHVMIHHLGNDNETMRLVDNYLKEFGYIPVLQEE
jgi:hypothetical protein